MNTGNKFFSSISECKEDLIEVKDEKNLKKAMEIAAVGGHNLLMIATPVIRKDKIGRAHAFDIL